MARFSGKIQSAKFVDIDEKTIEVLYSDDDSSILSSWYLQVDYDLMPKDTGGGTKSIPDLVQEVRT